MSKIGRGTQYDGFLNAIIQIMCDLMFLSLKKFGKQEKIQGTMILFPNP